MNESGLNSVFVFRANTKSSNRIHYWPPMMMVMIMRNTQWTQLNVPVSRAGLDQLKWIEQKQEYRQIEMMTTVSACRENRWNVSHLFNDCLRKHAHVDFGHILFNNIWNGKFHVSPPVLVIYMHTLKFSIQDSSSARHIPFKKWFPCSRARVSWHECSAATRTMAWTILASCLFLSKPSREFNFAHQTLRILEHNSVESFARFQCAHMLATTTRETESIMN